MNFKVAILQKNSINRDFNQNTDIIITNMELAANNKADILLIPECFITGYELPIDNQDALPDNNIYISKSYALQLNTMV